MGKITIIIESDCMDSSTMETLAHDMMDYQIQFILKSSREDIFGAVDCFIVPSDD